MSTTRFYVNAIIENEQPNPIGSPTPRLDLVQSRIRRKSKHRFYNGEETPIVIAYRDMPDWQVME